MITLTDNTEFRIDYFIKKNVDIYDTELPDTAQIIFGHERRKCLIRDKQGKYIPSPFFKETMLELYPFNLCYFMFVNNTYPDPADSDFDIGFNNANISFEDKFKDALELQGYHCYFINEHKFCELSECEYSSDKFNGFIVANGSVDRNELFDIIFDPSELQGIMKVIALNMALLLKVEYFSGYNYIFFFEDTFPIESFIDSLKENMA